MKELLKELGPLGIWIYSSFMLLWIAFYLFDFDIGPLKSWLRKNRGEKE